MSTLHSAQARRVLSIESDALIALNARLANPHGAAAQAFDAAVTLLLGCTGRVVVSGIGKSGHIARKLAATFASTGTPAFFVHPAEASHGDLGMVTAADVMLALSYSGETSELMAIVPVVKRMGAKLIALTGAPGSGLAQLADVHLDASVAQEACPLNLAPTASTTAALALGDALAVACLEARGFGTDDFARSHPGGSLGKRLLTRVSDVMRTGAAIPHVPETASVYDAILEMTKKGMGMVVVTKRPRESPATPHSSDAMPQDPHLAGVFTDGNLRRALELADGAAESIRAMPVTRCMTLTPRTIAPDHLAAEAVALMETHGITQLIAAKTDVSGELRVAGVLNMHDLFRAKVV